MPLHQAVHGGQPQPRPLPRRLRGEERLEDACLRVFVHPEAGVAHGKANVLARAHCAPGVALILGEVRASHLDP
jgi:hypothetical protein